MKKLYSVLAILIIAVFMLSACAPASPAAPPEAPIETQAPEAPVPTEAVVPTETVAPEEETPSIWDQAYISEIPPILMIEPYYTIFGQSRWRHLITMRKPSN